MNTQSALAVLARIEEFIDSAQLSAQTQGKSKFWERDKAFISAVRACLRSNELERVRWAFDQMRNVSQAFGSYCGDLEQLDHLLDELHNELEQLMSAR